MKSYISAVLQYKILHRPVRWKHWAGRKCLDQKACNQFIYDAILSGKPFVAARFGNVEMGTVITTEKNRVENREELLDINRQNLSQNAGMFSVCDDDIRHFVDLYKKDANQIDLLGIWFAQGEECLLKKYAPSAQLTKLKNLEPYYEEEIP